MGLHQSFKWGAVVLWAYSSAHGAKGRGFESPPRHSLLKNVSFGEKKMKKKEEEEEEELEHVK